MSALRVLLGNSASVLEEPVVSEVICYIKSLILKNGGFLCKIIWKRYHHMTCSMNQTLISDRIRRVSAVCSCTSLPATAALALSLHRYRNQDSLLSY